MTSVVLVNALGTEQLRRPTCTNAGEATCTRRTTSRDRLGPGTDWKASTCRVTDLPAWDGTARAAPPWSPALPAGDYVLTVRFLAEGLGSQATATTRVTLD